MYERLPIMVSRFLSEVQYECTVFILFDRKKVIMRTVVTINGTAISLYSIIRFAQPQGGRYGKFFPRQWVDPPVYQMMRESIRSHWAEEKHRQRRKNSPLGDMVETKSGGYIWLYHLDAEGNLRSDAFTWLGGIPKEEES